jgi:hypothetical protein
LKSGTRARAVGLARCRCGPPRPSITTPGLGCLLQPHRVSIQDESVNSIQDELMEIVVISRWFNPRARDQTDPLHSHQQPTRRLIQINTDPVRFQRIQCSARLRISQSPGQRPGWIWHWCEQCGARVAFVRARCFVKLPSERTCLPQDHPRRRKHRPRPDRQAA